MRRKSWRVIFFIALIPSLSFASMEVEFSNYLNELKRIDDMLTQHPECRDEITHLAPCTGITDSFCNSLWSEKNKGNLVFSRGKILAGDSAKSEKSQALLEHYRALAGSLKRLPKDLQGRAAPHLKKLEQLLDRENNSEEWGREVSEVIDKYDYAFVDTVIERAKEKYPEMMKKKKKDRTPEEELQYDEIRYGLYDEAMAARYKENPNWKRVEKVFGEIRKDLMAEVETLNLDPQKKKEMIKRLAAVKLDLPSTNPEKGGDRSSCGTTEVNASYFPNYNKISVCAGLFNSYQSESALYFVLAHELGHSIDSGFQSKLAQDSEGKFSKLLYPLIGANGKGYSCTDWERAKKELQINDMPNLRALDPLDKLDSCMVSRDRLLDWDQEGLKGVARKNAKKATATYADDGDFLKLSEPSHQKEGKKIPNPFYLNPTFLSAHYRGSLKDQKVDVSASGGDIFTQNLLCLSQEVGGQKLSYEQVSDKATRAKMVEKAIDQTVALLSDFNRETFKYCGQTCSGLVNDGYAVSSQEQFADWFATKAIKRHLNRLPNPKTRREASAAATALFCNEQNLESEHPHTVLAERKFSYKVHPDDRSRRHFLYSPENAKLLGCESSDIGKRFSQCEP